MNNKLLSPSSRNTRPCWLPLPIEEIWRIRSWMEKDLSTPHMESIPKGIRERFVEGFDTQIERYLSGWAASDIGTEQIQALTLLVDLREGRSSEVAMSQDMEALVEVAYQEGRVSAEQFLATQLSDHARGLDPETQGDRSIWARYGYPRIKGHSPEQTREIMEIQSALQWLHGEGLAGWRHGFQNIPHRIHGEVGGALVKAMDDLTRKGDVAGASSVQLLIEGGKIRRGETHWTVADRAHFVATHLPDLETALMNQLVEKGFLAPEKERVTPRARHITPDPNAPKKSFSMER